MPVVDAVATCDAESGETSVFLVNRSLEEEVTIDIDVRLLGKVELRRVESLYDDDIHAANTLREQERVGLRPNESARLEHGTVTITLPPVSWTAITLG